MVSKTCYCEIVVRSPVIGSTRFTRYSDEVNEARCLANRYGRSEIFQNLENPHEISTKSPRNPHGIFMFLVVNHATVWL